MSLILSGSDGVSDIDGTAATPAIRGTDANTGIFFPAADTIAFSEGGAEAMRIDSSGNVGIGVVPPTATFKSLFVGNSTNLGSLTQDILYNDFAFGSNAYFDTTWKYSKTGEAAVLFRAYGYDGQFFWQRAPSGTAGNTVSFTQVMAIDASANLLFNSGYGSAATAYGCRAWVNFNGTGTPAIRASGNVSSVSDGGTGSFGINYTTAIVDANYAAVAGLQHRAGVNATGMVAWENPYSTTQIFMYTYDAGGIAYDPAVVCVAILR